MGDKLTPSWNPGDAWDQNPKWHNGGSQQDVPLVVVITSSPLKETVEPLTGLAVWQTLNG